MALYGEWKEDRGWGGAYLKIVWSATQNISENYSTVHADLYFIIDNNHTWMRGKEIGAIWILGNKYDFVNDNIYRSEGTYWLKSMDHRVDHNENGFGSFDLAGDMYSYAINQGFATGERRIDLDTIPRKSIPGANDFTIGEDLTVHMYRKSSQFKHYVEIRIGQIVQQFYDVQDNCTWKTKEQEIEIYKQIQNSKSGKVKILVKTYHGDREIGRETIHCNAHISDANPIFLGFSIRDINPTTLSITKNNQIFIQGQSRVRFVADMVTTVKEGRFKEYLYEQGTNRVYSTETTIDLDVLSIEGFSVTAIDKRGFETKKNLKNTVYPYRNIRLGQIKVKRQADVDELIDYEINGVIDLINIEDSNRNKLVRLQYCYKLESDSNYSEWVDTDVAPILDEKGNFSAKFVSSKKFGKEQNYHVKIRCTDLLTENVSNVIVVVRSIPLIYMKKNVLGINKIPQIQQGIDLKGDLNITKEVNDGAELHVNGMMVMTARVLWKGDLKIPPENSHGWHRITLEDLLSNYELIMVRRGPFISFMMGRDNGVKGLIIQYLSGWGTEGLNIMGMHITHHGGKVYNVGRNVHTGILTTGQSHYNVGYDGILLHEIVGFRYEDKETKKK